MFKVILEYNWLIVYTVHWIVKSKGRKRRYTIKVAKVQSQLVIEVEKEDDERQWIINDNKITNRKLVESNKK